MSQADGSDSSPATIKLPEKTYFKIGEVAKFLEVEPYVLRYWETEFDVLSPEKTNSGQRVYQRDDIELLFQIRTLLYEEMFTIAGACRQLERSREGKSSYFDLEAKAGRTGGTAMAGDEELRQQLQNSRRELAAAQTDLGDARQRVEKVEDKLETRKEELEGARQKVESLEERVQGLVGQSDRLRSDNEELRRQLAQAQRALQERDEAARADDEVANLKDKVARLKAKLKEERDKTQTRRRRQKQTLQERRERRRHALKSLRREVETVASLAESGGPRRNS